VVAASGRRGERVSLQVTCRRLGLPRVSGTRLGYGTARPDALSSARVSGGLFGGPGGDRLTVRGRNGVAFGDLGDDTIVVSAASGVAVGGLGADRLVATRTARSLLVGGPGHDTFLAGPGSTFINAVDGERDRIVCAGPHNRVLVDRRDVVRGPCRPLRTGARHASGIEKRAA
jgi:Ca2+-binding RTX toxin-like protein